MTISCCSYPPRTHDRTGNAAALEYEAAGFSGGSQIGITSDRTAPTESVLRTEARRLLASDYLRPSDGASPDGRCTVARREWRTALKLAKAYLDMSRLRPREEWTPMDGWALWWYTDPDQPTQPECIGPEPSIARCYRWWTPIPMQPVRRKRPGDAPTAEMRAARV